MVLCACLEREDLLLQVIQLFIQLIFFTSVFFQLPGVMKIRICNLWSGRCIILGSTDQGVKAGSKKVARGRANGGVIWSGGHKSRSVTSLQDQGSISFFYIIDQAVIQVERSGPLPVEHW
jgi:hypothetical protein